MAWKDELRPASFRGIPFFVSSHEYTTGRRVISHEFPFVDEPYNEDSGKKIDGYSINAYVIGAEYTAVRDLLIAACQKEGDGELVHPYYGTRFVNCTDLTVSESTAEGGVAALSLKFIETGEETFAQLIQWFLNAVALFAAETVSSIGTSFESIFVVAGLPAFVATAAGIVAGNIADTFDSLAGLVSSWDEEPQAAYEEALADFKETYSTLALSAEDLFDATSDLFDKFSDSVVLQKEGLEAMTSALSFGDDLDPVESSTETRAQQATNQEAIVTMVKGLAILKGGIFAATVAQEEETTETEGEEVGKVGFDTAGEAVEARETLLEVLDEVLESEVTSDELYKSYTEFRAKLVAAVPPETKDFNRIETITTVDEEPSVLLSYRLYESLENEQDILNRNGISNPLLLPERSELEVILA